MQTTIPYLSKDHATYLKALVAQAKQKDINCNRFGAKSHQYQLEPVVSLEQVRRYEQKHNIKLPSEYVFFITEVGNGGAGPDYGIWGIDTKDLPPLTETEITPCPPYITPKLTQEQWEILLENEDDDFDVTDGTFCVGTKGCTYFNYIISDGTYENMVYYFDANYEESSPPFVLSMKFLEWYENYFLEVIQGNDTFSFGYLPLYTQAEVLSICTQQTDSETKKEALRTLYRFPTLQKDVLAFLEHCQTPELVVLVYDLLLKFEPEKITKDFRQLIQTQPEVAIAICRDIPDTQKDAYYADMLHLLYHFDSTEDLDSKQKKILVFLEKCHAFSAADILPFAKDETQPPTSRGFAFDQMCFAPDKRNFEQDYMEVLRHCDEPDVVKNVLTLSMIFHSNHWLALYLFVKEKFQRNYSVCWSLDFRLGDYGLSKCYQDLTEEFDDIYDDI